METVVEMSDTPKPCLHLAHQSGRGPRLCCQHVFTIVRFIFTWQHVVSYGAAAADLTTPRE